MKKILNPILILIAGILFITLSSTAQVKFDKDWTLRKDMPVFTNPEIESVKISREEGADGVYFFSAYSFNDEIIENLKSTVFK